MTGDDRRTKETDEKKHRIQRGRQEEKQEEGKISKQADKNSRGGRKMEGDERITRMNSVRDENC